MNENIALNQTWADHIEKWRASGVSIKAFCEQEGLVYHQFSYWRQKFSPAADSTTASKLVPVALATSSPHTSDLEILLPNGVIIRGIDVTNVSLVPLLVATL
ncbi:IS66 family insertion sequence element accessory protein TnpB [Maribrevibacterium harenarium]|uniref:IS66 family insertion sequence element accessory protein TnpB n=1 Tax=Maribrevibacterium harenarium TaxID=2589817 RepID=A0A501W898_9GAMM|nr:IS66 family insertion sequence element accessory protein TnpB [Maribrevibacterium harenarium]TPE44600.1 IS66 family insertion sequence element accessory protein TnpB [Maribrevibacterium harenarium]